MLIVGPRVSGETDEIGGNWPRKPAQCCPLRWVTVRATIWLRPIWIGCRMVDDDSHMIDWNMVKDTPFWLSMDVPLAILSFALIGLPLARFAMLVLCNWSVQGKGVMPWYLHSTHVNAPLNTWTGWTWPGVCSARSMTEHYLRNLSMIVVD